MTPVTIDDIITVAQQIRASGVTTELENLEVAAGLEPLTAFTDAILAAWVAFLAGSLFARAQGRRPVLLWAWAFVATVVSSLAGVAYHGWRVFFDPLVPMSILSWKFVPIATGIAALCLGSAAAPAWLGPRARKIALAILVLEFVVCIAASLPRENNSFAIAGIDYLVVLIALAVGCALHWSQRSARFIAAGIAVSLVAIAVQMSKARIGSFDHNDVFHVIQMGAMYLLYRGGVRLAEGEEASVSAVEPALLPEASA